MLLDLTHKECLDNKNSVQRVSFNKLMLSLHKRINESNKTQASNTNDPIPMIADQMAKDVKILFCDHFLENDITNNYIASKLFDELFKRGVVVFLTSNQSPDDLFKNEENLKVFIENLKQHLEILNLKSTTDYRKLKAPLQFKVYFQSDADKNDFEEFVNQLIKMKNAPIVEQTIEFLDRKIHFKRTCNRLLDTDFSFMCKEIRSSIDYLKFCNTFDTIVLRDIPDLISENELKRFMDFINTVYDKNVKLVCSGQSTKIELILSNLKPNLESDKTIIDQTISRLIEMQSESYWKKCENK